MVKLGIIVEGDTEKLFVESNNFKCLCEQNNLELIPTVINAEGNGNLCSQRIDTLIEEFKNQHPEVEKILILADLDPDICAPCITRRKAIIGETADYIVIARNAIEAWFLADLAFLRQFFSPDISSDLCQNCEQGIPADSLQQLSLIYKNKGISNKKLFMKRNREQLNLHNAAQHSPSAAYLLSTLQKISQTQQL